MVRFAAFDFLSNRLILVAIFDSSTERLMFVVIFRDNRRGQPDLGAMEGPHPGGTALLITVTPTPGKYALPTSDRGSYSVTTTSHSLPLEGQDIY
jgi:hypothetical protein